MAAPITPWNQNEARKVCEKTRTRVLVRCTDLLEIDPITGDSRPKDSRVNFLHRTVYDFLETPEIQNMLIARAGRDFDANRHLYNANLSLIKRLDGTLFEYRSFDWRFFWIS